MKLLEPENKNYAATIVRIPTVVSLEGLDNLVGIPVLGSQALVSKDHQPGEMGIVFTDETQLSEEYARVNNLHRHGNLNDDEGSSGYLEDNRRIRALRLRGHASNALFMPLESLSYIKKLDLSQFNEGDTFDRIGDHLICNKYVLPRTKREQRLEKNKEKFVRVEKKFLPEHYDTDNYFRYAHIIPESREVTVTQKLHGTSVRIANTYVARKLSVLEQIAKRIGVLVSETTMDTVYGSRRVIKDVNNPGNHFYTTDIHTETGARYSDVVPQGYILYGEIIGWETNGPAIQKDYTYGLPEGTNDLYVYRVAHINPQGLVVDLTYDQMVEFCRDRNLNVVPLLWRGLYADFAPYEFVDGTGADGTVHGTIHRFHEDGYPQALPLSKGSPCDEGVCIRAEGMAPYILKAKSDRFREFESKNNDKGIVDLESSEAI